MDDRTGYAKAVRQEHAGVELEWRGNPFNDIVTEAELVTENAVWLRDTPWTPRWQRVLKAGGRFALTAVITTGNTMALWYGHYEAATQNSKQ